MFTGNQDGTLKLVLFLFTVSVFKYCDKHKHLLKNYYQREEALETSKIKCDLNIRLWESKHSYCESNRFVKYSFDCKVKIRNFL